MTADPRHPAVRDAARAAVRLDSASTPAAIRRGGVLAVARARNDALRAWAAASILHGVSVAYPEMLQ